MSVHRAFCSGKGVGPLVHDSGSAGIKRARNQDLDRAFGNPNGFATDLAPRKLAGRGPFSHRIGLHVDPFSSLLKRQKLGADN